MGTVYRATRADEDYHKDVAIKFSTAAPPSNDFE